MDLKKPKLIGTWNKQIERISWVGLGVLGSGAQSECLHIHIKLSTRTENAFVINDDLSGVLVS